MLVYVDGDKACQSAFAGGPVALALSRFSSDVRERVCARYLADLAKWRDGGYRVPAEFVVVAARRASLRVGAGARLRAPTACQQLRRRPSQPRSRCQAASGRCGPRHTGSPERRTYEVLLP